MELLEKLLKVAIEERDQTWETDFLCTLANLMITLLNPEPQRGPDGWPYLLVSTDVFNESLINYQTKSQSKTQEPVDIEKLPNILSWLSTRGIGLVVNPQKSAPDYVLTYGMIWNFRERGEFLSKVTAIREGTIALSHGQEVLTLPASEAVFPTYVRSIVKQFFLDQGVFAPKILMVSFDKVNYDVCFSVESLKSPPQAEHSGIAEALAWFFPAHYTISLVSEKAISGFVAL